MPATDRRAAAQAIDQFLLAIGRDPSADPELNGTGARVADAFVTELCAGYAVDTQALLRDATLDAGASKGSLVVVRDLPVVTTCPHHLMTAFGTADVAMKCADRILGIGAIGELVDAHARRLTLQEHIGEAVATELAQALGPTWVACRLRLTHGCMVGRGHRPAGAKVETLALRGVDAALALSVLA